MRAAQIRNASWSMIAEWLEKDYGEQWEALTPAAQGMIIGDVIAHNVSTGLGYADWRDADGHGTLRFVARELVAMHSAYGVER